MSEPLRDLRTKVSADVDQVLTAVALAAGKDKAEVVREILHQWHLAKVREAQMISRLLPAQKGGAGEGGGV